MASFAYGAAQTRAGQLHHPETCYAAQGFVLSPASPAKVELGGADFVLKSFSAQASSRQEHVWYWMRVGARVVYSQFAQAMSRYDASIRGKENDGVIVRVSLISKDRTEAQTACLSYVRQLWGALDDNPRRFFFGGRV